MYTVLTENYKLRLLSESDSGALFEILRSDKVMRGLNLKKPQNIADAKNIIESYLKGYAAAAVYPFAVEQNSEMIGAFILKKDPYRGEESYECTAFFKESLCGRGILQEVLPPMKNFCINELKAVRLRSYIKKNNEQSIRAFTKAGFTFEMKFKVDEIDEIIISLYSK